jgi:hypothetical protein
MRRLAYLVPFVVACDVTTSSDLSVEDYESLVLARAAIEFSCPSKDITITSIDQYTYLAAGCGYRATYECDYQVNETGPNECQRAPDLEPVEAGCR